jgi:hypothetical protein
MASKNSYAAQRKRDLIYYPSEADGPIVGRPQAADYSGTKALESNRIVEKREGFAPLGQLAHLAHGVEYTYQVVN